MSQRVILLSNGDGEVGEWKKVCDQRNLLTLKDKYFPGHTRKKTSQGPDDRVAWR
jgi:hypothetical protein